MYNVSEEYRDAMKATYRPYNEVYGTITFSDGTSLSVDPTIIPENTLCIARQCISGEGLEFGGVFSHILDMQVRSNLSRYMFYGAEVVLSFRIMINDEWETVPLGIFIVSEAENIKKNVKFTAYDNMKRFDIQFDTTLNGTPYNILAFLAQRAGVTLAFDEAYVLNNFVNADIPLTLGANCGLKTYRDAVKVVCQQLGCFAQINRDGLLELRKFSTTVDATWTTSHWENITIMDYECRYSGLMITSESGSYAAADPTFRGLVMNIPDAPAWDEGFSLQEKTDNLFNELKQIVYTPCAVNLLNDPSFDCGDRIKLVTSSGDEVETIITSYEWKWHGGMEMDSKGINPNLTGASTNDIGSTRLLQKGLKSDSITYYPYTNATPITITEEETLLYEDIFITTETANVMICHEFIEFNEFTGESQSVQLFYYYDEELLGYSPIDTWSDSEKHHTQKGDYWLLEVASGLQHTWKVTAKTNGGTAFIDRGNLISMLWGQKLYAQEGGLIPPIDENYVLKSLGTPRPITLDDSQEDDVQVNITDTSNKIITEDNVYITTEDGNYIGMEDQNGNDQN